MDAMTVKNILELKKKILTVLQIDVTILKLFLKPENVKLVLKVLFQTDNIKIALRLLLFVLNSKLLDISMKIRKTLIA